MTREEIYNAPKCAGIYCIKNTINGKCYIGQAIKLQKRLKAHWKNFSSDSYSHIVIYKAFKKYGIENFELTILKTISDSLSQRTKKELDELEKFYIEKYDSYNNGYNSTLGGDGGVLGYNHTEETKEKLREYAIAQAKEKEKDESNWYKAKNIFTGEEIIGCSQKDLSEKSKIPYYTIRNCIYKKQLIASKNWIIARYLEEYPIIPDDEDDVKELINNQFKTLSNKQEILEYIKENPKCTYGEISQNYKLCKKTFYNYKKELGISFNQRIDTKVTKEEFLEFGLEHTKEEFINHFNISEDLYYRYRKKYTNDKKRRIDCETY